MTANKLQPTSQSELHPECDAFAGVLYSDAVSKEAARMSSPDEQIAQLRVAIAALEGQRAVLGGPVVEAALWPLREALAALEQSQRAEQQRKQVTVLFADVSGFTAMAEKMDAEDVAAVMNELWLAVDRSIAEHGGHIDKHIGDAVMALWGADTAREDDPERAIRAALAMQAAVASFQTTRGAPLAMRIGINTGPVVVGMVGTTGEFTALGDAVNLASRLERVAPVGGILIGHDTYRHVRGIFDVQAQETLAVRGRAEPVRAYRVLRAKPRAFRMATRGVEGIETRMVGREAELRALQTAYAEAMGTAQTRVATVIGEAGVGKSRLLYEFENWLELRPETIFYFRGRATPNTQNVPYSLFRDLFAFRFDILESDTTAVALDKFRRGMAGALEPDLADVVGHWLGFDFSSSPAVQRLLGGSGLIETARAFLVRFIRTLAAEPVVVFLEDIHWADDPSLELAIYLVRAIPAARLFIVAVTRSSLFERRPNWSLDEAALTRIVLRPLSKAVSQALVDEILQRVNKVPDRLRDLISDAADGNPFYMEEMVKMLIDQGVIERGIRNHESGIGSKEAGEQEGGGEPAPDSNPLDTELWTVRADKLAALKVPPTLTALLQTRLDGLPPAERAVLQRASVIGRLFWDDAVADLHQSPREAVGRALAASSARELLFHREPSAFAGVEEYIFRHGLLHEVTYETVLLKRRAEYHRRAARWLESHAGERLGEYLTLIAEHYIRAGERRRAATLLEQSAREALELGAYAVARPALERALALREAAGERDGPAVTAALVGLGQACLLLGDFAPAEMALERGLAGARAAGDQAAEAEALAWLARIATGRGDYDRAWVLAGAALPMGQAIGGRLLALTQQRMAQVLWAMGDLAAAETYAAEALTASRAAGDMPGETGALNALGIIASDRRQLPRAMAMYEQSLALARRTNHLSAQALALLNLGNTAYLRGDYAAAADYAQSALERFQELGQQHNVSMALANRAQADIKLGHAAAARRGAREALALVHSLGAQPSVLWTICLFGQLLAQTGDTTQALALYGLARAQPALDNQLRVEIDEELAGLGLPPDEVAAGLAAGARLDLATVIDEILAGHW